MSDELDIEGKYLAASLANEKLREEIVTISGESLDFNRHKEAFEREFIVKALKMFKGRINQTALHANIPKKTLLRKIEKYGIVAKDFAECVAALEKIYALELHPADVRDVLAKVKK